MAMFDQMGRALRWLREERSLRQYEVASAAGVTKAMLSAYETGKQKPSLESLEKILLALGCDLLDLHEALELLAGRPSGRRGAPGAAARSAPPPPADVRSLLGIEGELSGVEEQALEEVISGFHKLVRYLHRTARSAEPRPAPSDEDEDEG